MRLLHLGFSLFLGLGLGCATTTNRPVITADQEATFRAVVEKARKAGATGSLTPAGSKLADAESDFYYAQHLPSDPARARRMAEQAQAEAEAALTMAQGHGAAQIALTTAP